VRTRLIARARRDARITGAAVTGSATRGAEDRWSDIDLFVLRALRAATAGLVHELEETDAGVAAALWRPLVEMAGS
jgi:predicted nucleotidyltransferase